VVISGITFTRMIQYFGPVRSTMITALVPGLSALGAVLFLGEPLHWNLIAGLLFVTAGILFGVMHGDVWRFVPTTILGVLLSWVALTSGSIIPSMLVHVLNNSVLIVLGYYGLDQAGDNLSGRASVLILGAAVIFMLGGLAAIRRAGRQTPATTGA